MKHQKDIKINELKGEYKVLLASRSDAGTGNKSLYSVTSIEDDGIWYSSFIVELNGEKRNHFGALTQALRFFNGYL